MPFADGKDSQAMKECLRCRHCFNDEVELCPHDRTPLAFTITGDTTISGRYILESRLGQGGMGIVFKAKHKFLKSLHAVKVILPSLVSDDKSLLVRFRQEAILAASIDHPNVIRVTDFGVENDLMPFLVMEFVSGTPLSFYLIDGKPLPLEQAYGLFMPAVLGVAEAHHKGIVHRDLKPQNIMVQKQLPFKKAVKVLDFGLAKIKSVDAYPSLIQAKTMNILGSPPYMSPEQWTGEDIDHRTDIYSLAVILFQMLTGRLPFQAESMPAMMYQHLTVPPPSAASLGISLPPDIEAVVQKALLKEPSQRYSSLDEMLNDLGRAVGRAGVGDFSHAETEYLIPPRTTGQGAAKPAETVPHLSDSQRERFYTYFDPADKPVTIPDETLAQEFLEAQDRVEKAKTQAVRADLLVKELVEAQREAAEAQEKAIQAKQQIEADVRRQVEAEMERLVADERAKHEAEARRLAEEVDARRKAEERANQLAQSALEAQRVAESERKRREEEAQQRELHEGVRRQAESAAQQLAEQVAEEKRRYEEARQQAEREARFRLEAEARRQQIERDLHEAARNEAEQRRLVEAEAKKQIQEQAERFEKEAVAARQRLDEARLLVELETQKREQAEAARVHAEQEARRLSQEILEVQRQMEEMQLHISVDSGSRGSYQGFDSAEVLTVARPPGSRSASFPGGPGSSMQNTVATLVEPTHGQSGQISAEIPVGLLDTGRVSRRRMLAIPLAIGVLAVFLAGSTGVAYYLLRPAPPPSTEVVAAKPEPGTPASELEKRGPTPPAGREEMVLVQGGSFQMGRDDVPEMDDRWGKQFGIHEQPVSSFYMDKTEVTNEQYAEFVTYSLYGSTPWPGGTVPAGKEKFPVTNVSLADAAAYARWVSERTQRRCSLPTEAQWEYAARNGSMQTPYPWGEEWQPNLAVLKGAVAAVGTSGDKTIVGGIHDLLGNVSEWTTSRFAFYPGHRGPRVYDNRFVSVRGLNWKTPAPELEKPQWLITHRNAVPDEEKQPFLGFRLVCEP